MLATPPPTPAAAGIPPPCTRIVLDPGHDRLPNFGLEPVGPKSHRLVVKDFGGVFGVRSRVPSSRVNLKIALKARDLLRKDGYCVTMTRTKQGGVSMGNVARARIANKAHAALWVRIHCDGSGNHSRHGTATLYPAFHKGWTDDVLPASKNAAKVIQSSLAAALGSRDLGTSARKDVVGFNWANVPVVLAEVGFMTNPGEDRLLTTNAYKARAAQGIVDGIMRFVPPSPPTQQQ
ncbi:MAG: N-acetylmuramoyl-L-alanine amidase [Thermoleophilaceae bacterium]